ncbi:hypothetical protein PN823_004413 [Enterobacter hormaechei]|nr:hypothetical protein [Enterobacter hormaechei]
MAKPSPEKEAAQAAETIVADAAQEPNEYAQSLDDFCRHLSLTEPRYMLISAFHYSERTAGRLKDLPSAYARRYADSLTQPV